MQVKNLTDSYVGFTVRTNPTERVTGEDAHGNKISKPATPNLVPVRIPPLATVEIDDEIWAGAWETKATRQEIHIVKEQVQVGARKEASVQPEMMTLVEGTGKFRPFYPVREMIAEKILEIVEKPVCTLSVVEMRELIEARQGYPLPKDVADELIVGQYERMF